MGEKQELISKMIDMQKKLIAREQAGEIEQEAYYSADQGGDLHDYQKTYTEMANRLLELAHAEKGSKR